MEKDCEDYFKAIEFSSKINPILEENKDL